MVIIKEVFTGTTTIGRDKWERLVKLVKPGDTIVFDSVSRMSRNAEEGFALYKQLFTDGIELVFLKEPHINSSVFKKALANKIDLVGGNIDIILKAINEYLMAVAEEQIKLAFAQAEKEVSDLHQRTKEGMKTAALNGKKIGRQKGTKIITRKSREAKKVIVKHAKAFDGTLSDTEVMVLAGVSKKTYYEYKRELKELQETHGDGFEEIVNQL